MFFIREFFQRGFLHGTRVYPLNDKFYDFVVTNSPFFSLLDYQKIIIRFYMMAQVLHNLLIREKKIALIGFHAKEDPDSLGTLQAFLPATELFSTWYPGVLTNADHYHLNSTLYTTGAAPAVVSDVLLNFGTLGNGTLYNEVERTRHLMLTTTNTTDPIASNLYCLPLNTQSPQSVLFMYYFFSNLTKKMYKTASFIHFNKSLRRKYSAYMSMFLKFKRTLVVKRARKVSIKILRQKPKLHKLIKKFLKRAAKTKKKLKLAPKGVRKKLIIPVFLMRRSLWNKRAALRFSKKAPLHRAYYNYYRNHLFYKSFIIRNIKKPKLFMKNRVMKIRYAKLGHFAARNRYLGQIAITYNPRKKRSIKYQSPKKTRVYLTANSYAFIRNKHRARRLRFIVRCKIRNIYIKNRFTTKRTKRKARVTPDIRTKFYKITIRTKSHKIVARGKNKIVARGKNKIFRINPRKPRTPIFGQKFPTGGRHQGLVGKMDGKPTIVEKELKPIVISQKHGHRQGPKSFINKKFLDPSSWNYPLSKPLGSNQKNVPLQAIPKAPKTF
jgi:hypothetical protein